MDAWGRKCQNKYMEDVAICRRQLEEARDNLGMDSADQFLALRQRLAKLLYQEDRFWRKRANNFWYNDRNPNTKFFHAAASAEKRLIILIL